MVLALPVHIGMAPTHHVGNISRQKRLLHGREVRGKEEMAQPLYS